jgi:hypothetical protein
MEKGNGKKKKRKVIRIRKKYWIFKCQTNKKELFTFHFCHLLFKNNPKSNSNNIRIKKVLFKSILKKFKVNSELELKTRFNCIISCAISIILADLNWKLEKVNLNFKVVFFEIRREVGSH